jgi:pantothenate kinase
VVDANKRFILVEGNYLLLDEEPWSGLAELFDLTIFLDVPRDELERRLVERWRSHGRSEADGRAWIDSNDLPNVDRVLLHRRAADLTI